MFGTLITFGAATAVLSLAALGFVGVGLRPPAAELGLMMTERLPHYLERVEILKGPARPSGLRPVSRMSP